MRHRYHASIHAVVVVISDQCKTVRRWTTTRRLRNLSLTELPDANFRSGSDANILAGCTCMIHRLRYIAAYCTFNTMRHRTLTQPIDMHQSPQPQSPSTSRIATNPKSQPHLLPPSESESDEPLKLSSRPFRAGNCDSQASVTLSIKPEGDGTSAAAAVEDRGMFEAGDGTGT